MKNEHQTLTSLTVIHSRQIICQVKLRKYTLPFKSAMYFKGHTLQIREGFILYLVFADGTSSVGEVAPLPGFSKETLYESLTQLKGIFTRLFANSSTVKVSALIHIIEQSSLFPSVRFALDCALGHISSVCIENKDEKYQQPLAKCNLSTIETPLLIGSRDDILTQYKSLKLPNRVKLKVGQKKTTEDASIVNQLWALNSSLTCILDANQAWNTLSANEFAVAVNHSAIAYIEEPCKHYTDSIRFSQQHKIPIALDETLQDSDFNFIVEPEIAAVVIKPTLMGSFERCKSIITQALEHNVQIYISSSFESPIGISQLQTLSELWVPKHLSGLDTLKYQNTDSFTLTLVSTWPQNSHIVEK